MYLSFVQVKAYHMKTYKQDVKHLFSQKKHLHVSKSNTL